METEAFKVEMTGLRNAIAPLVEKAVSVKNEVIAAVAAPCQDNGEMIANITLAYRALEDAAMRFGKAIQASAGGKSPLGGPNTPGSDQGNQLAGAPASGTNTGVNNAEK